MLLRNDGSLWQLVNNQFGQLRIGNQQYRNVMTIVTNNVAAVSATYGHTLILKADGSVYGTGANSSYQLGLSDTSNQLHSLLLLQAT